MSTRRNFLRSVLCAVALTPVLSGFKLPIPKTGLAKIQGHPAILQMGEAYYADGCWNLKGWTIDCSKLQAGECAFEISPEGDLKIFGVPIGMCT